MNRITPILSVLLLLSFVVNGQTDVSGFITKDSVWTLSGSPYQVTSNLQISSSGSLTIDAGVEVEVNSNTSIIVLGHLNATDVVFTSMQATKQKGDWNSIEVQSGGEASFSGCTIEYGGYSSSHNSDLSLIYAYGGDVSFSDNCIIRNSNNSGIRVRSNSYVSLSSTQITACRWPIVYTDVASVIFDRNTVTVSGNTYDDIYVGFTALNSALELDTIAVSYVINETFNINTSGVLTVKHGSTVEMNSNTSIVIAGVLNAFNTTFTSMQASKQPGDWNCIDVRSGGRANFTGCTIEYGGYNTENNSDYSLVYGHGGDISFSDNCVVKQSKNTGIRVNSSSDINLSNTQITNCRWPIVYKGNANVVFDRDLVSIIGNTDNRIFIDFTSLSNTMELDTINISYFIPETFTINNSGNLITDSGVTIEMNTNKSIIVEGILNSYGTTFTSKQVTKQPGDWNNIEVKSGGNASFSACTIEYGGYSDLNNSYRSSIYANGGNLSFLGGCMIRNSKNAGLIVRNSSDVTFSDTQITLCRWPVIYKDVANIDYDRDLVTIADNTFNGVYIDFSNLSVHLELDTIGVPYVFTGHFNVYSGGSINIAAGNIVKLNNSVGIFVKGGWLKAIGSAADNIYFTSYRNDNLGGDTNNDGAATPPSAGNWHAIKFEDPSIDANCMIKYADFSFGGSSNRAPVWAQNASPTIEHCNFENNYIGAYIEFNSKPVFSNNTIGSSSLVPFALTLDAAPVFSDNTFSFSDNEYDAIGIISSTLTANAILPQRDVTGIPNVTYLLLGAVTIPESISLTINPGVVVKGLNSSCRINVRGIFVADGEDDANRIAFTSVKDDNYGNPADTNKDGTQTFPAVGNWSGIVFEGTSDDDNCLMNYTTIQYASLNNYYVSGQYFNRGEITMVNASPVISNNIIKDCYYGVYALQASHPEVTNNQFVNSVYTPVAKSMNAYPEFSENSFVNPGWTAIGIIGEKLGFDAILDKDTIAGYNNIAYVQLGNLTINSGTHAQIKPGVVLKFNNNTRIYVDGGFKVEGLANDSIIFTSIKDDNYGVPKDTKNDGDAEAPASGNWNVLRYTSTADDSYNNINYARFLYGGGESNSGVVTYIDAAGVISNSLISNSYYYGLRFEGTSEPDCSNNVVIQNCRLDPIAMSLKSDPVMSFTSPDIVSNGNGSNGIRIIEGNLATSASLFSRDVGGIYNIAYIIDRLTIGENAVLTIAPGVVIKFVNYYSQIIVDGALNANGMPSEKIVFTSIMDDSKGGDTNDDGNISTPTPRNWSRVIFNASSLEDQNIINNCIFNYGGHTPSWYRGKYRSAIDIFDAYVEIDSTWIEHVSYSGIGIFGSANPVITNSQFNNIGETPIILSMFSNPVFSNNSTSNIGIMAFGVAEETYSLDATIPQRNFAGYNNLTYFIYRPLTVNSGTIINIPESTVFKTGNQSSFVVNGGLKLNGTSANPVVFTHVDDDAYGIPADTKDDGSTSSPYTINHPAVVFNDISIDDSCIVDNTIFRYFRSGVNMEQAAPEINSSLFELCDWGVELRGVSTPAITNNTFSNLTYAPMVISLVSFPRDTVNNVISGSTYKAIGVLGNEELVQDVTLKKNNFAGVRNIPYYFSGNYSIGTSVNLTISPGVVCKFNRGARLTVKRGLIADGGATPDSTIVFTDIKDDFFGGDTNSNGKDNFTNNYYNWKGIIFADESYDDSCRLDNCIIRYAGHNTYEAAVTTNKASPVITNSSITYNSIGIKATGASNPIINNCDIFGNTNWGVQNVDMAFDIDARNNYWGSNTGPTHSSNPTGTGDAITDKVIYSPFNSGGVTNPLMGDVSINGFIQAYDASLILKHAASMISLSDLQLKVADVSGEAGVTAYDAGLVLQYVSGIIDAFPAEYLKNAVLKSGVNEDIHFIVEDKHLAVDETEFSTNLLIESGNNLSGLDIVLQFDSNTLKLNSVESGVIDSQLAYSINNESGMVTLAFASAKTILENGVLATLNFSLVSTEGNETTISFGKLLANEQNVIAHSEDGVVTPPIATNLREREITNNALYDIYPNPSDGNINIEFDVAENNSSVKLSIVTSDGKLIDILLESKRNSGHYTLSSGKLAGFKGVVLIKLQVEDEVFIRKVVVK